MIHPVIPYVLLALGLIATTSLFFTLKLEVQRNAKKYRKRIDGMAARLEQASEWPQGEPRTIPVTPPPRSGFNLSKRFQAMRMLRRGEDIAHISAALGVPRKEVELLIRIQRIGAASLARPVSETMQTSSHS